MEEKKQERQARLKEQRLEEEEGATAEESWEDGSGEWDTGGKTDRGEGGDPQKQQIPIKSPGQWL